MAGPAPDATDSSSDATSSLVASRASSGLSNTSSMAWTASSSPGTAWMALSAPRANRRSMAGTCSSIQSVGNTSASGSSVASQFASASHRRRTRRRGGKRSTPRSYAAWASRSGASCTVIRSMRKHKNLTYASTLGSPTSHASTSWKKEIAKRFRSKDPRPWASNSHSRVAIFVAAASQPSICVASTCMAAYKLRCKNKYSSRSIAPDLSRSHTCQKPSRSLRTIGSKRAMSLRRSSLSLQGSRSSYLRLASSRGSCDGAKSQAANSSVSTSPPPSLSISAITASTSDARITRPSVLIACPSSARSMRPLPSVSYLSNNCTQPRSNSRMVALVAILTWCRR